MLQKQEACSMTNAKDLIMSINKEHAPLAVSTNAMSSQPPWLATQRDRLCM